MAPPFDRAEYAARLRRTRAAMRAAGLDVLLVFHQEHMFYLAGYDQIGYWVYQVLVVPAAEEPMTAVVRKVDELLVRDGGIVDDVRVWLDDATRDPAGQTADILAERGLINLRIKETDPHVLQEGMSFLFHSGLLAPEGDSYVAPGDPVLVTATGHERLTRLSRDLTVK